MTTNHRKDEQAAWEQLAAEVNAETGEPLYKNAASNADFWKEANKTIETVEAIIDERTY